METWSRTSWEDSLWGQTHLAQCLRESVHWGEPAKYTIAAAWGAQEQSKNNEYPRGNDSLSSKTLLLWPVCSWERQWSVLDIISKCNGRKVKTICGSLPICSWESDWTRTAPIWQENRDLEASTALRAAFNLSRSLGKLISQGKCEALAFYNQRDLYKTACQSHLKLREEGSGRLQAAHNCCCQAPGDRRLFLGDILVVIARRQCVKPSAARQRVNACIPEDPWRSVYDLITRIECVKAVQENHLISVQNTSTNRWFYVIVTFRIMVHPIGNSWRAIWCHHGTCGEPPYHGKPTHICPGTTGVAQTAAAG